MEIFPQLGNPWQHTLFETPDPKHETRNESSINHDSHSSPITTQQPKCRWVVHGLTTVIVVNRKNSVYPISNKGFFIILTHIKGEITC